MTAKELLLSKYPEIEKHEQYDPDASEKAHFNTLRFLEAVERANEGVAEVMAREMSEQQQEAA